MLCVEVFLEATEREGVGIAALQALPVLQTLTLSPAGDKCQRGAGRGDDDPPSENNPSHRNKKRRKK